MDAHPETPEHDTAQGRPLRPQERERRVCRRHHREGHEDDEADAVEQAAEDERARATHAHRHRVGDRRPALANERRLLEVVRDEREVGEAGRHETRARQVEPERARQPAARARGRRGRLELFGTGIERAGHGEGGERARRGDRQRGKGQTVIVSERKHRGHGQRSEQGPELIQRLVQAERPPVTSHLPAGVGQQDGPRRVSDRLADPLEDQQRRRRRPAPGQRQRGDRGHLDDVAEDGDGPELTGTIRQSTRDHAQAVAGQLAEAADDPDRRTGGAEQGEVRTGDAPRALVGEVGEEAHDADEEHEAQGPAARADLVVSARQGSASPPSL